MNRWGIPGWLEQEVIARDIQCIYCRISFQEPYQSRRARPSWEHTVNDATIITRENIARCCIGCNASKGVKPLSRWLDSPYCRSRGITENSIAPVAQAALYSSAVARQGDA